MMRWLLQSPRYPPLRSHMMAVDSVVLEEKTKKQSLDTDCSSSGQVTREQSD